MNQEDDIGALWKKKSAKGNTYLSGSVQVGEFKIKVVGFINKEKKNEREPDIRLYKSKPPQRQAAPSPPPAPKQDFFEDDIPF